ncbi:hypothetical protein ACRAWF_23230 [Streptomyces sp. L7]
MVPGEAAYLMSARGVTVLRGAHAETLAPLLDGTRTLSGILSEASRSIPLPQAEGRHQAPRRGRPRPGAGTPRHRRGLLGPGRTRRIAGRRRGGRDRGTGALPGRRGSRPRGRRGVRGLGGCA